MLFIALILIALFAGSIIKAVTQPMVEAALKNREMEREALIATRIN